MKIEIQSLMTIQQEVNRKIREKLLKTPEADEMLLAFNTELFEYFNAIGTWKWWKHSHKIDKERILDELADCFAFFLSLVDIENEVSLLQEKGEVITGVEEEMNEILGSLNKMLRETDQDRDDIINDLMVYIGSDNEIEPVLTIERFTIAIFIATVLFFDITWEEMTEAYLKKSSVNIQRQEENY